MQFPNPVVYELTAPNNVPFQPGNVVTGFGAIIPPELTAVGFVNAIVFYDQDWSPTATTPKVKFRFIASGPNVIQIGYGYCANPSVSQTATVVTTESIGASISGSQVASIVSYRNAAQQVVMQLGQLFGSGDPIFQIFDGATSALKSYLQRIASTGINTLNLGMSWEVDVVDGANIATVNGPIQKDTTWQAFTLSNGWFGAAAPDAPVYRMMPDGTCMMEGLLTKASAPVNGEQWGSVATAYRPTTRSYFHACSDITVDANQKIRINTDGTCVLFDPNPGNGSICLAGVRYPVVNALT